MRKELFVLSTAFLILGVMACSGTGAVYLALLSALPLGYGYMKGRSAALFPIILGLAMVIASFSYPWDMLHVIMLSIAWPGVFAMYALHSVPASEDMEKSVIMSWGSTSMLSAGALMLIPAISLPVENAFILAIIGLLAGLALAYMAWK
jgi:hypothetical protein